MLQVTAVCYRVSAHVALCFALTSFVLGAEPVEPAPVTDGVLLGERFSRTLGATKALTRKLKLPEHFQQKDAKKKGGEFDPETFLAVMKNIKMEKGYRLDYVYHFDKIGGYPILYVRKIEDQPFESESALVEGVRVKARLDEVEAIRADHLKAIQKIDLNDKAALAQASLDLGQRLSLIPERTYQEWYLDHIEADGSPEGYLELVAFRMLSGRFYLYWHANYLDDRILPDTSCLDAVFDELRRFGLNVPSDLRAKAERIDYLPTVSVGDEVVRVSVVIFTKWGGFQRRTYTISARFPHKVMKEESLVLLAYQCNMRF